MTIGGLLDVTIHSDQAAAAVLRIEGVLVGRLPRRSAHEGLDARARHGETDAGDRPAGPRTGERRAGTGIQPNGGPQ